MTEVPELTYDALITLARQQGFELDTPRLKELFQEVQAMYRRIKLLDAVDTSGVQPISSPIILTDPAPRE